MPRPTKTRFVSGYPVIAAFVPEGVPVSGGLFLSRRRGCGPLIGTPTRPKKRPRPRFPSHVGRRQEPNVER